MRIQVRDQNGSAQIQLISGIHVIGVANISWRGYEQAVKSLLMLIVESAKGTLSQSLGARLWQDALSQEDGDSERAKKLLGDFNWNQEKIDSYANELARNIAQDLVDYLPEHR